MGFNQTLADKILEFATLEPTIPVGAGHDFRASEFEEDDFKDTAKRLISSGQITALLKEDYSGLFIEFRQ
ncbi:hypothetical protein MK511_03580 [Streptococcus gordonii]|uniref:hypothetical protein n=1 Tax=Streptococcus gordonii TaxID=1302 RepID=UPI002283B1B3|nr:hypothetical protein [Streptococcus gordonii]MCY7147338.1 hypothetical protein [Streptococcus gordonii]